LVERTAERDETEAQKAAMVEVLQLINSSPGDLAPVFDAILEKTHTLCGANIGVLGKYDGEHLCAVATRGLPERHAKLLRQPFRPLPNSPYMRLLGDERIIHITDLADETAWERDDPKRVVAVEMGFRTILFVPLRKDGALLGWI